MRSGTEGHVPVLVAPALDYLAIRPGGVYVDATVGGGGHAALIAAQLSGGQLIGLDRDPHAVALATARLAPYGCATILHRNYSEITAALAELGIEGVDGVLLDAGCSSMQLDTEARGFSFQSDGPLDMRMDTSSGLTAAAFLAGVNEHDLAQLLRDYGDVGPARRIAKAILARRDACALRNTSDLAEAVAQALDFVQGMPEETRTVFQAIRIAVNDELRHLEAGLQAAIQVLRPGGRLVVITFHSGEAQVAKKALREASRKQRILTPDGRVKSVIEPVLRLLTPKAVAPTAEELGVNPRAASARLRAAERLRDGGG